MAKIGVFDSGVGGRSVANALQAALPQDEIIFVNDTQNVPYGTKHPDELYEIVLPILNKLSDTCDVVVVACNTVSTTLIGRLREVITTPLVAMEPMIKPAAELTKTGVITVCATPTTLVSKRYHWLKNEYAKGFKVIEPDCSDWSYMIENNEVDEDRIEQIVEDACQANTDVIVLGCTHYHWIEDLITRVSAGRATVLQPEQPVITQVKKLLTNS